MKLLSSTIIKKKPKNIQITVIKNPKTFSCSQNYIALISPSHQEIRRSKMKTLVKHNNKKPKNIQITIIKNPKTFSCSQNYVALISPSHLEIRRSKMKLLSSTIIENPKNIFLPKTT